jgi:hypothetical protein
MKRAIIILVTVILIVLIGLVAVINYNSLSKNSDSKPFYVGVTFGGDTTAEAKLLIDKVKNYTNLFVLQSGTLQRNTTAMNEIGDYVISSNLNFAVYGGVDEAFKSSEWVNASEQRWGKHFLGIYYNDESGGKMLDASVALENIVTQQEWVTSVSIRILKNAGGGITFYDNETTTVYQPDGEIIVSNGSTIATYYPNGTITLLENGNFYTTENGTKHISQIPSYEQVLKQNPIPNCDAAAEAFVSMNRKSLESLNSQEQSSEKPFLVFTADYGLYWWDYQSGYDLVLAELGWNNSVAQEIGLVRGAANLQGKSWGTILTWKYTHAPYLTDGQEMFGQMKASYEAGAEYVVVFNYAEDMSGPYGTLQEEHFQALERFWNQVVQNPNVVHGGVKAEAALVLPQNYGWGMRNPTDKIWGIWNANSTSQQIWIQLQSKLAQYGLKLDIVFDDPAYPVLGKYSQIYYWNQTG